MIASWWCYVQPQKLPLKRINKDGKMLGTVEAPVILLPSFCFFSPCDDICICLSAENIQIYGLETDKDELLHLHTHTHTP